MKIDPAKWQDEDWDIEDDIPGKKLTHREKIYNDEKKASIQKKRREKLRVREEEEKLAAYASVDDFEDDPWEEFE